MASSPTRPIRSRARLRRVSWAALFVAVATVLAGCGLGTAGGFSPTYRLTGPLAEVPSMKGASVAVGSKNFSEQLLLGKMAVILLKSAGADVQDYTNIPGSSSARQAQIIGQVQMEWEYTGTAWISYLNETDAIPDERKQYEAVRDADAKNGLTWLEPAPMNNTYGFAVPEEKAKQLGITKLSQIKDVPAAERTFCVESEFNSRNDGFQPMLKKYDITDVPGNQVKIFDTGAIYAATSDGLCTFGEVFTTDGRILAQHLTVLEDDKNYFPKYNVAAVIDTKTVEQYPQIQQLFAPVAKKLTNDVLLGLNARIDVNGEEPVDVASEWLQQEGFVQP